MEGENKKKKKRDEVRLKQRRQLRDLPQGETRSRVLTSQGIADLFPGDYVKEIKNSLTGLLCFVESFL